MAGPPADGRPTCTSCARTARRSASADRTAAAAASAASRRDRAAVSASSRLPAVVNPPWDSSRVRRSVRSAWARSAAACSAIALARSKAASAACARAVSSARVRASSSAGATGWKVASRVRFARTGSPGSSSIRSTRPATGAETTKRSRTRVSPSSSSVTWSGPGATLAISAGTGAGRNAHTSVAITARTTTTVASRRGAKNRATLRGAMGGLFAALQDLDQVEVIEPPAHDAGPRLRLRPASRPLPARRSPSR